MSPPAWHGPSPIMHPCRQRHGGPDQAYPGGTASRGSRDCVAASPDDRLRRHDDPEGEGPAAESPANAGATFPRTAGADRRGEPVGAECQLKVALKMATTEASAARGRGQETFDSPPTFPVKPSQARRVLHPQAFPCACRSARLPVKCRSDARM